MRKKSKDMDTIQLVGFERRGPVKLFQEREKVEVIKETAAFECAGWRKKATATVKEKGVVFRSWLLLRVLVGGRKL